MQVIAKANEKIANLWGRQQWKNTEYRLMQYTISVEVDEGYLLHNVMTGELVLLSKEEWELVKQLPCSEVDEIQQLIEKRFIVPVDCDEHKVMLQLRSVLQMMETKGPITGYTILPTTHCNARCFYCYESNIEHVHMSEETAIDVVEFIDKNHGDKSINLGWFGGEPLVGIKRIDQICELLSERGIEYSSHMITNGYLFDQDIVIRAKEEWKLKSLQITLDGTEDVYNRIKSYTVKDDNPYKRVMDNIQLLLDAKIAVSIRLNMDKHNHLNLEELIDELAERFGDEKRFSVNVAALFDDCGFEVVSHSEEDHLQLKEWLNSLNQRLKEKNLTSQRVGLPILRSRFCMADHDESVMITPSGEIHKCEHHIDDSCVGDIYSGITELALVEKFKQSIELSECEGCPLQPDCYHIEVCENQNHCKQSREDILQSVKLAMLKVLRERKSDALNIEEIDNPIDYKEQQLLRS